MPGKGFTPPLAGGVKHAAVGQLFVGAVASQDDRGLYQHILKRHVILVEVEVLG